MVDCMCRPRPLLRPIASLLLCSSLSFSALAELPRSASLAFDTYVRTLEARLHQQHATRDRFLASAVLTTEGESRLRGGHPLLEQLTPLKGLAVPGGLLHHWRGTAFVPGVRAARFEQLLRNFRNYPQVFAPDVLAANGIECPDRGPLQVRLRVRQKHVLTVVLDTTYAVTFEQLDPQHGDSVSRSTEIAEVASPGTTRERTLRANEEHGFVWRINTYWTYEERNGGLYLQIESVSLTRLVPSGLGWAVAPYLESIPRESLEFTLRCVSQALTR